MPRLGEGGRAGPRPGPRSRHLSDRSPGPLLAGVRILLTGGGFQLGQYIFALLLRCCVTQLVGKRFGFTGQTKVGVVPLHAECSVFCRWSGSFEESRGPDRARVEQCWVNTEGVESIVGAMARSIVLLN